MAAFNHDDKDGMRKFMESSMPGAVDQAIRQAVHFCWMGMPDDRQNLKDVGNEVRRILERTLRNWEEDEASRKPNPPAE